MKTGTHRPISSGGVKLLETSVQEHGLIKEAYFVVKELQDSTPDSPSYEIIEGNHRKLVFQNAG